MSENRTIYKHVAVIGIDGMGVFNKQAHTPRMDEIFQNGAVTYTGLSMNPTISAQNWGGMLLGATPEVHKLTNAIVSVRRYHRRSLPSLFLRIRRENPDAVLASYCHWNPINHGIVEHRAGVDCFTAKPDGVLTDAIVQCVTEKKPLFLFVQLDDVDGAGHGHGYGEQEYLNEIERVDACVGRIYDAYRQAGIIDDTLFLVNTDHGGIEKSHGGWSDTEKIVFLGAAGKGVPKGEIGFTETRDIAAIVLHALGLSVPETDEDGFSAQIPDGIFADVRGVHRESTEPMPPTLIIKPTPAPDSEGGLWSFLSKERFKLALFLDNDLSDAAGHRKCEEHGTVKFYSDGIRGERAEFGETGHTCIKNLALGSGSFSLSMWVKTENGFNETAVLCADKVFSPDDKTAPGLTLTINGENAAFSVGGAGTALSEPFPKNLPNGWLHIAAVLDREEQELRLYYNFGLAGAALLGGAHVFDRALILGEDASGSYNASRHLLVNIDDFFVINGALGETELKQLKAYYGLE